MAASQALVIPQGAVQGGAGAHIGSGVDVLSYRRIRDTFLDLQYRAQATRLGEEAGRAQGLDRAELALAEPGDNGINKQLVGVLERLGRPRQRRRRPRGRARACSRRRTRSPTRSGSSTPSSSSSASRPRDEYAALAGGRRRGRPDRPRDRRAQRHDQALRHRRRHAERPDGPARPAARPALHARHDLGRQAAPTAASTSTFGGAGAPMIDATGYHAEPLGANPGGRLGALKELSTVPGGLIDSYRTELGAVAQTLADVGQRASTPASSASPTRRRRATAPPASPSPVDDSHAAGRHDAGRERQRARAARSPSSAARRPTTPTTRSSRGSAPRCARRLRNEANAQALTDAVQDRRESVAGVSLDEEMGNLIRFQRAYQASSRAMSTMDEMLDVLINRTGRVGL